MINYKKCFTLTEHESRQKKMWLTHFLLIIHDFPFAQFKWVVGGYFFWWILLVKTALDAKSNLTPGFYREQPSNKTDALNTCTLDDKKIY